MLRFFTLTVMVAILAMISWGCAGQDAANPVADAQTDGQIDTTTLAVSTYCGKCGQTASDTCCAEVTETCEHCQLAKGSALCCVELDETAAGQNLCAKCGHVAGSDSCCAEGAETCEHCQLAKGSPLCCQLADSNHEDSTGE